MAKNKKSVTSFAFQVNNNNADALFDNKIESATAGLRPRFSRYLLEDVSNKDNALTIAKYILSLRLETNLSDHYRQDIIKLMHTHTLF